jgi:hypothetical protein
MYSILKSAEVPEEHVGSIFMVEKYATLGHSCVHRLGLRSYKFTTDIMVFSDTTEEPASSTFRVEAIQPKHMYIHTRRHGVTSRNINTENRENLAYQN